MCWVGATVVFVVMWCAMIRLAERRGRRRPFADCAAAMRDVEDETDIATEGLGTYPPPQRVRDGWLIPLSELHDAAAEAVFGAAGRPQ